MATWVYESVTASVAASGGGTVQVETTYSEVTPSGATQTILRISATPSRGYKFDHWTYDTSYTYKDGHPTDPLHNISYSATRYHQVDWWSDESSTTLEAKATHYTAFFIPNSQTPTPPVSSEYNVLVIASPYDGGTVTGGGVYAAGASCTIVATPSPGWRFLQWSNADGGTSTNATHTFSVTKDVVWTAHFERKSVWVLASCSPDFSGVSSINPPYTRPIDLQKCNYGASGDSVHLLATASPGWRFLKWTGPGGYTSTSADVTVALSESYVAANQVYDGFVQGYTLPFVAKFEPTAYNTIKLRILEGADCGTLQRILYWSPNEVNSAEAGQFVTVIKDTASEYEVRVPVTYGPKMPNSVTGPTYGGYTYTTPLLAPVMTRNRHVYKYVVTLNGAVETYEAPPRKDPEPPMYDWALGYFDETSYQEMWDMWERAEYLSPDVAKSTGNGATLTVDFYLKRIATGKILCTTAGKILSDPAGNLLYDG